MPKRKGMCYFIRVLKNRASRRDPALRGFCKCSHIINRQNSVPIAAVF